MAVLGAVLLGPLAVAARADTSPNQPSGCSPAGTPCEADTITRADWAPATVDASTGVLSGSASSIVGATEARPLKIHVERSAGHLNGIAAARLCRGSLVTVSLSAQLNPSAGGNCIGAPFHAGADDDFVGNIPADSNHQIVDIVFHVGRGTETNHVGPGTPITCDATHPCTLWVQEAVDTTVHSSGNLFKHFNISFSGVPGDFDADNAGDQAVYRPSNNSFYVLNSNGAPTVTQWGVSGDKPEPGDYDGDGKTDAAVWRPSNGNWYVVNSSNGALSARQWGLSTDTPVPGDYDGDGKTDNAVWRSSTGTWYVVKSSDAGTTVTQWGLSGDIPVPADYDGDGRVDPAVFRPATGTWYVLKSMDGSLNLTQWGASGDIPVPADYDGDGKADLSVWRHGYWYSRHTIDAGTSTTKWGTDGDQPQPLDFDKDGKVDLGVWRSDSGNWYVLKSTDGTFTITQWGIPASDIPIGLPTAVREIFF